MIYGAFGWQPAIPLVSMGLRRPGPHSSPLLLHVVLLLSSPVLLQEDRAVVRKLPDQHDHPVAAERGGRAGVQRLRTVHQVTRRECTSHTLLQPVLFIFFLLVMINSEHPHHHLNVKGSNMESSLRPLYL